MADSVLIVIDVQEAYRNLTVDHEKMVRQRASAHRGGEGGRRTDPGHRAISEGACATRSRKSLKHCLRPERIREDVAQLLASAAVRGRAWSSCAGHKLVVCGIEAHACVNQTTHDLLEQGYQVHLPADAVSARFERDYRIGWEKMIGSGAVPSTVEMVCLEWVRTAEAPEFKAIHRLIK